MAEAIWVLLGFAVMEPVTYLAHRLIFHGFGYFIHESHHEPREGAFELNDLYPVISACLTMGIIAIGVFVPGFAILIPFGFGVTTYGLIYFFIHDVVIHERIRGIQISKDWFPWHVEAHRIHHRSGGEPYGLLFPIVPSERLARADLTKPRRASRPAPEDQAADRRLTNRRMAARPQPEADAPLAQNRSELRRRA